MDIKLAERLVPRIETARRNGHYDSLIDLIHAIDHQLGEDNSAKAWKLRSKATYEWHMAMWQRGEVDESLKFALWAAAEARNAGDMIGELYPWMNISGLILPAKGELRKGLRLSAIVDRKAQRLAASQVAPAERIRAHRIMVNTCFHRIGILIALGSGTDQIAKLLAEAEANYVYQADPASWAHHVESAQKYLKQSS